MNGKAIGLEDMRHGFHDFEFCPIWDVFQNVGRHEGIKRLPVCVLCGKLLYRNMGYRQPWAGWHALAMLCDEPRINVNCQYFTIFFQEKRRQHADTGAQFEHASTEIRPHKIVNPTIVMNRC